MGQQFYVLLSDVVASSQTPERDKLTENLEASLERINRDYRPWLHAPCEITQGDKMAAVLTSVSCIYDLVVDLDEHLEKWRCRSVVSFGELTAGLSSGRAGVMDGPAAYAAVDAMAELKKGKQTFTLTSGHGFDEPAQVLVNLLQWRWSEMTDLQRRIVRHYQRERNQQRVAELVKRSQQQVSHSLIATKWELINSAEASVRRLLEDVDQYHGTGLPETLEAARKLA